MPDYKKMYLTMLDTSTNAISALEKQQPDQAWSILINGQQTAENIYIETSPSFLDGVDSMSEQYRNALKKMADFADAVKELSGTEREKLHESLNYASKLLSDTV